MSRMHRAGDRIEVASSGARTPKGTNVFLRVVEHDVLERMIHASLDVRLKHLIE